MFEGIRAVLFDFDGTLVQLSIDFARMRAVVMALLSRYGVSAAGRASLRTLELVSDVFAELSVSDGTRASAFKQDAEAAVMAVEMEAAERAEVFLDVPRALDQLRARRLKIAIVT